MPPQYTEDEHAMQTLIHNKLHLPTEKGNQVWQHVRPISLTQDTEIAACLSCDQQVRGVLGNQEGRVQGRERHLPHSATSPGHHVLDSPLCWANGPCSK